MRKPHTAKNIQQNHILSYFKGISNVIVNFPGYFSPEKWNVFHSGKQRLKTVCVKKKKYFSWYSQPWTIAIFGCGITFTNHKLWSTPRLHFQMKLYTRKTMQLLLTLSCMNEVWQGDESHSGRDKFQQVSTSQVSLQKAMFVLGLKMIKIQNGNVLPFYAC